MDIELLNKWVINKSSIFVYTLTVRLRGIITRVSENCLTLDNHTIVIFNNIISVSDIENKQ
jgi:hypothetical protein